MSLMPINLVVESAQVNRLFCLMPLAMELLGVVVVALSLEIELDRVLISYGL